MSKNIIVAPPNLQTLVQSLDRRNTDPVEGRI